MLEYALKQERAKYNKLKYGSDAGQTELSPPTDEDGVELPPLGDPARLATLLDLLEHRDAWVRCNAVRLLRIETKQNLPWRTIADDHSWSRAEEERRIAVDQWRAWAAKAQAKSASRPSARQEAESQR